MIKSINKDNIVSYYFNKFKNCLTRQRSGYLSLAIYFTGFIAYLCLFIEIYTYYIPDTRQISQNHLFFKLFFMFAALHIILMFTDYLNENYHQEKQHQNEDLSFEISKISNIENLKKDFPNIEKRFKFLETKVDNLEKYGPFKIALLALLTGITLSLALVLISKIFQ